MPSTRPFSLTLITQLHFEDVLFISTSDHVPSLLGSTVGPLETAIVVDVELAQVPGGDPDHRGKVIKTPGNQPQTCNSANALCVTIPPPPTIHPNKVVIRASAFNNWMIEFNGGEAGAIGHAATLADALAGIQTEGVHYVFEVSGVRLATLQADGRVSEDVGPAQPGFITIPVAT